VNYVVCDYCDRGVIKTAYGAWGPWQTFEEKKCSKFPDVPGLLDQHQVRFRDEIEKCNYCGHVFSRDFDPDYRWICTH
jgi:hypothetical protein